MMNTHHLLDIFGKRNYLSFCKFVLWIALFNTAFYGSSAALPSFNVEELCRAWKTSTIDLLHYRSGTLISSTSGTPELTCIVQFKAGFDSAVVLSLYKFSLEPLEELVIEDAQNFKVGLIGEGDFPDERHSFQSDGYLTLHYTKNRTSDYGSSRTKFQFTFTLVHSSPCKYEEFECRNLNCIPKNLLCDRHNNCGDNSDEQDCSPTKRVDEDLKREVVVHKNASGSGIWIISIIVCATLLGIIIIVFSAVLIRRMVVKKKEAKNAALPTVESSVPPPQQHPEMVQQAVAPSMVSRIRQSFRRSRNTHQSAEEEGKPNNFQVPSMYPEVPSAPEYYAGVDNPEFKADE